MTARRLLSQLWLRAASGMPPGRSPLSWAALLMMLLLGTLAVSTIVLGLRHMDQLSETYYKSVVDQLEAISELKRDELTHWRNERLGDARVLHGTVPLQESAIRLQRHPGDQASKASVRQWLELYYRSHAQYESIFLTDAEGRILLAHGHSTPPYSATLAQRIRQDGRSPSVRLIDFYRDENDGEIYCAAVADIASAGLGGKPLGHIVMRISARSHIFPLIEKWPVSSATGETVLLRREGNTVLYLSNMRTLRQAGTDFTMPLSRLDVVGVRAARGEHGVVNGLDFMGVPVVAAITTLSDGSWSIETKMAQAEIEQNAKGKVRGIGLLVAALAASMVAGVLSIWQVHRQIVARNELEAENRLHRSESQFRSLIETMAQGLVKVDALGMVTYSNSHFLSMLGRSQEEVVGQEVAGHLADAKQSARLCDTGTIGQTAEGFEVVWLDSRQGKVFSVVTPVLLQQGEGICGERWLLVLDITKRRHLESQLLQSQKLEAIGQLAAGIAHEINTPAQYVGNNIRFLKGAFEDMLGICGKARELCRTDRNAAPTREDLAGLRESIAAGDLEYLETEVPGAINQTIEGVERISTIVRSVKQFAHPPSAAMSTADLNEAMQSTATVSRNEWKYVADLEMDLDGSLPMILCMIGEINQVVLNLIVNAAHAIADAVKADPERKGHITLSTRHTPPWAEIRVSDTGTGIPAEAQGKVFDPFFTTKEVGKGTGQGLAIARTIVVEKHHGQLFFETEPGVGTTFVVRLPLAQAEE